jgi:hypothetical protein
MFLSFHNNFASNLLPICFCCACLKSSSEYDDPVYFRDEAASNPMFPEQRSEKAFGVRLPKWGSN